MSRKRISEYREADFDPTNSESWIGRQSVFGLFAKVIGVFIALSLLFGVIGYAGGWFNEGKRIVGVENVREQYTQLQQDYESLEAIARNSCRLQKTVDGATDPDIKSQRESQVLATDQNYERVASDYDRRWANAFEAKIVGPRRLPTTAPSLEDMKATACPS